MSGYRFHLHHVSLLVSDTRRALDFYCGVLGMAQTERPDLPFPGAWLQIAEHQQIHLLELPSPDPVEGRPAHGGRDRHFALVVPDLEVIRRALEAAGWPYSPSKSGRRALFCRDPDGNAVEFFEKGVVAGTERLFPDP
ncbi:glyoxylase I family protein [Methylomarinovum tepidoasis]|uniref:Glyoxylase I family protein n=1 Tax=Methylomarinovum tepidoasis TaxID=2840183 RepID=A0AAU9D0A2_9GAMM|nr:VOC family protein [Methylomarinovum sp. IN45]BCX88389.1 glyoxylase I family protein [Methylomarinovum sp. IN45]